MLKKKSFLCKLCERWHLNQGCDCDWQYKKGYMLFKYDGELNGLPFDDDKIAEDVLASYDNLQIALMSYARTLIKTLHFSSSIDVNILLLLRPNELTESHIELKSDFYLKDKDGYLLKKEGENKWQN